MSWKCIRSNCRCRTKACLRLRPSFRLLWSDTRLLRIRAGGLLSLKPDGEIRQIWITYPDGRKALIDTLKTPYWGPSGELIGVLGISRDITAQQEAVAALRESE